MKRKILIPVVSLFLLILIIVIGVNFPSLKSLFQNKPTNNKVLSVSLSDLLNNPGSFNNKRLRVKGYLVLDKTRGSLYRNDLEAKKMSIKGKSVSVNLGSRILKFSTRHRKYDISPYDFDTFEQYSNYLSRFFDNNYVEVTGLFNSIRIISLLLIQEYLIILNLSKSYPKQTIQRSPISVEYNAVLIFLKINHGHR